MLTPLMPDSRISRLLSGLEVPQALRALVRARESALILLGALIGVLAGLVVAAMSFAVPLFHATSFGVERGDRLSALRHLDPWIAISVPTIGGLIFGLTLWVLLRWRPGREIDPIEANACMAGARRFVAASSSRCKRCGRAVSALQSESRPAIPSSLAKSRRRSAAHSTFAAAICAFWSDVVLPAQLPAPLARHWPVRFMPSNL
jgi:hypothetical protein